MKGIILAAGNGTRLGSLTETLPKPLVNLNGKPMILSSIYSLIDVGITEIAIVIQEKHESLFIEALKDFDYIRFYFYYQNNPTGIADALLMVEPFVIDEKFVMTLGDTLFLSDLKAIKGSLEIGLSEVTIAVDRKDNPNEYGVVYADKDMSVRQIMEKPQVTSSSLCIIGAYGFTPMIFKAIHEVSESHKREEILVRAINMIITAGMEVNAYEVFGVDAGTPERLDYAEKIAKDMKLLQ